MRVTFVHAPEPLYADTQNYGAQFMPVWAYTLASHLPSAEGFKVKLYDSRYESFSSLNDADLFLFSGINQDYSNLLRVAKQIKGKFPLARIVLGGPIAWSFDQAGDLAALSDFDFIFIGDGEELIADYLKSIVSENPPNRVFRNMQRFNMDDAMLLNRELIQKSIHNYYGAVVEVSRGCPFLCEFCDIRILNDNNRPHNKPASLIVEELDYFASLGVTSILLACDNFIGDLAWANHVLDEILEWQSKSNKKVSLYTWLTITLRNQPELMQKMRLAGFDMLFIGVESFEANSLLETAKLQNTSPDSLVDAIKYIQSFGFVVVGGLIFGFDSDSETSFQSTLDGLENSGMLSGDPSLLTALPGTPLFRRMKLAGRLRNVRYGLGGYKYQTNMLYLLPAEKIIIGYKHFITTFTSGSYQFKRLENFIKNLDSGNYIPLNRTGYGNPKNFVKLLVKNPAAVAQLVLRLIRFAGRPSRIFWVARGAKLLLSNPNRRHFFGYFQFWIFAWSNAVLKYSKLSEADFDIASVEGPITREKILPAGYSKDFQENIPISKTKAQVRATSTQLEKLIESKGL